MQKGKERTDQHNYQKALRQFGVEFGVKMNNSALNTEFSWNFSKTYSIHLTMVVKGSCNLTILALLLQFDCTTVKCGLFASTP